MSPLRAQITTGAAAEAAVAAATTTTTVAVEVAIAMRVVSHDEDNVIQPPAAVRLSLKLNSTCV